MRMMNKIRKKLSTGRGFSLGELLAATIILFLASQVMAEGVTFAVRMYNESLTRSHARQLCSTLTASIETELRYATSITYDESTGVLQTYFSPNYGQSQSSFLTIDSDEQETTSGEIAIKATEQDQTVYRRLISESSYSSFGLKAEIDAIQYKRDENVFSVALVILNRDNKKQAENTFQVIPVNTLVINQNS